MLRLYTYKPYRPLEVVIAYERPIFDHRLDILFIDINEKRNEVLL